MLSQALLRQLVECSEALVESRSAGRGDTVAHARVAARRAALFADYVASVVGHDVAASPSARLNVMPMVAWLVEYAWTPVVAASAAVSSPVEDLRFWGDWTRVGTPVFVLTPGLQAELALTDPGRLAVGDVPWPFPAFRIQLAPEDTPDVWVSGGRSARARWLDVHTSELAIYDPETTALASRVEALVAADPFGSRFAGLVCGIWRDVAALVAEAEKAELVGLVVGDALGRRARYHAPWSDRVADWWVAPSMSAEIVTDAAPIELSSGLLRMFHWSQRVAVNLALWLTSKDAAKRPLWTPMQRTQGKTKTWVLDPITRVDRRVRDAAAAVARGDAVTGPTVRHIVRGHYRTYHTGPKTASVPERLHIAPFWRGEGEARDRTYKL